MTGTLEFSPLRIFQKGQPVYVNIDDSGGYNWVKGKIVNYTPPSNEGQIVGQAVYAVEINNPEFQAPGRGGVGRETQIVAARNDPDHLRDYGGIGGKHRKTRKHTRKTRKHRKTRGRK